MLHPLEFLPLSLRRRVEAELQPGESVLYAGMPGPVAEALPTLIGFVFGVGWSSIAFTWEYIALAALFQDAPGGKPGMPPGLGVVFAIFGIPFVAIGVAMLAAPFVAALRALQTVHLVTDRRLVTIKGRPGASVETRLPEALTFLRRSGSVADRGTLRLGFGTYRDSDGDARSIETRWAGIARVGEAEEAIRRLARSVNRTV